MKDYLDLWDNDKKFDNLYYNYRFKSKYLQIKFKQPKFKL